MIFSATLEVNEIIVSTSSNFRHIVPDIVRDQVIIPL